MPRVAWHAFQTLSDALILMQERRTDSLWLVWRLSAMDKQSPSVAERLVIGPLQ